MPKYEVTRVTGEKTVVVATDDAAARNEAMIKFHGRQTGTYVTKDGKYVGKGLTVTELETKE